MKRNQSQKSKAWQGWVFKSFVWLMSLMPLRLNHAFGALIGRVLFITNNSVKRISSINIRQAFPELTNEEHDHLLKQSLMELGKTATELGPLWMGAEDKVLSYMKEVKGLKAVEEAFAAGKGVIVLSPHLGSWEAIGPFWSSRNPVTYLYRPPRMRAIEKFVVASRTRTGAKLAPTDVKGVVALRKALKNNEMLGILPDQDPGERGGIYSDFFGHPARTMVLVSKLVAKSGCAVFFNYAERLPKGQGYCLHILPVKEAIADKEDAVSTAVLNEGIADCIRQCPSQYQWIYKRYKNPPEGVADIYKHSS